MKKEIKIKIKINEIDKFIQAAIPHLPSNYVEVMRLRYIEGLKCYEIADALGLTLGSVQKRVLRAKRLIQKVWQAGLSPENVSVSPSKLTINEKQKMKNIKHKRLKIIKSIEMGV